MKILVIDDDLVLSDVIAFTLRRAGFEVLTAFDGCAATNAGNQKCLIWSYSILNCRAWMA